jgi:tyrosyl-tRNA synthetase
MNSVAVDGKKIEELLTRGVAEVIDREHLREALASGKKLRVKLGIDPTSPHIHIGRAVALRKLRAFQELGHTVIFIVGDATGVIGDTSDKDAERPMLTREEIKKNIKTYSSQAFKILDKKKTEIYFNSKWLKKIDLDELGRLANLFSLHEFEARENIAKRMSAGKRVSLREILYPLMQGYDSVAVKADVEIGGTDQKFNLLSGREIQRAYKQESQDILMTELLEGTDGRKMSSSWGNVINITDVPNDMFGKTMSIPDELIERYFVLATDTPFKEVPGMIARGPRDAKLALAEEIVRLYHGSDAARAAAEHFAIVFTNKAVPENVPEVRLGESALPLVDIVARAGFTKSKGEARRLIVQGAVKVAGIKREDPTEVVAVGEGILLQVGPRKFAKVVR